MAESNSETTETCSRLKALKLHLPVNKYILLALYLIVVLLRGCTYWGWNGIQEMLYKAGAYSWECTDPSSLSDIRIGDEKYIDCPERKNLLGGIFTTALGSNMLSSFLAGVILDALGPKITLLFGIIMDVVGWTLLGASGENFQAYYAAAFCIGVSADPGYLSLLSISQLFPKNSSFVISVLGSFRSISFAVPVIMSVIYQSPSFLPKDIWTMCMGYVAVGQGLSLLVCLLFVPMASFKTPPSPEEAPTSAAAAAAAAGAAAGEGKPGAADAAASDSLELSRSKTEDNRPFLRLVLDPKFLLLVPVFCCALVRSDYYAKSNKEQLMSYANGKDLYQMFAIFNILSFLPGPVFGRLADVYGIILVLFILNTAGVLMFVFLLFDNLVCKGISIIFFFVYTSFVLSNVYCFISIHFPSHAFGKLTGLTSAGGGAAVLISILWYKKVLDYEAPNNFRVVDGIMVAVGALVYLLVFALWRINKKEKRNTKVAAGVERQKTNAEEPQEPTSTVSVSV